MISDAVILMSPDALASISFSWVMSLGSVSRQASDCWSTLSIAFCSALVIASIYDCTRADDPNAVARRATIRTRTRDMESSCSWPVAALVHLRLPQPLADINAEPNLMGTEAIIPVLEFNPAGKLLTSFGGGMFAFPHGFTVAWLSAMDIKRTQG